GNSDAQRDSHGNLDVCAHTVPDYDTDSNCECNAESDTDDCSMMRWLLTVLVLALATSANAQTPIYNGESCGGDLSGSFPNCTVSGTHLNSPLPIQQGGTNAGVPVSARGPNALNIDSKATPGDADYSINPFDRSVQTTVVLSAPRTWLLPPANSVNPGQTLDI